MTLLPHDLDRSILRKKAKEELLAFVMQGIESPSCGQTPKEMIAEIKKKIDSSSRVFR